MVVKKLDSRVTKYTESGTMDIITGYFTVGTLSDDGSVKKRAGVETQSILAGLKTGDSSAIERVKQNISVNEKYQPQNFDLITWFIVS